MSEYLSKKAVLEWLDDRRYKSPWIESFRGRLESGAFDADTSEIQRLRAELCELEEENRKLREDIERIIEILKNGQRAHWQTFKIRQLLGVTVE